MTTLTYSGTLTATTCWCGIGHAVPSALYQEAERNHKLTVYCPLGHQWVVSGETEAEKLQRLLNLERDRRASVAAERDQLAASLRTTKGVVTKMRKRAIVGACQFCHRTFANVARHVATKHPAETPEPAP